MELFTTLPVTSMELPGPLFILKSSILRKTFDGLPVGSVDWIISSINLS